MGAFRPGVGRDSNKIQIAWSKDRSVLPGYDRGTDKLQRKGEKIDMREVRKNISKEEYKRIVRMESVKARAHMINIAPIAWRCGYGIYSAAAVESDGEFYVKYTIGDSCD